MDNSTDSGPEATKLADMTAVLDWWREAGVDCVFEDEPRQWIMATDPANSTGQDENGVPVDANSFPAVKTAPSAPPPPPRAMIGGDRANWPTALAGFAEWWLNEPSLDAGQLRGRVPPRGPQDAALMVLVCEPETADDDRLLSGPHGRLLAAMLAAMGITSEQVYFASALPRHTPIADWTDLAKQGLGEILKHHIALAQPRRLIAFGRHLPPLLTSVSIEPPLVGNTPAQNHLKLTHFSQEGRSVPLLIARDLGSLLERPIAKGTFWQHWLEWSAG